MHVVLAPGKGGPSSFGLPTGSMSRPRSYICVSALALFVNPLFGLLALIFSCWSLKTSEMSWEDGETKGKIALSLAIFGFVTSLLALLIYVLVVFTKES